MDSTVIDFDEIGAEGARAKLGVTFSDVKATVAVARGENSTAQHPVGSAMVTQKSLLPQGSAALNNCMPINRTSNSIARSMSEALTNSPLMKPTFFTTPMDAGTIKSKLSKAQSVEDGKHLPDHHDKGCNEESPEQPPIEDNSSKVGFLTRAYNTMQVVKAVALSSPLTVIGLPLIVFIILAGLGVYGTLAGANAYSQSLKDAATNAAVDTSTSFTLSVQQTFAPLLTLATYIQLSPDYTTVLPSFPQIADVLLSQLPNGTISTLQFSPFGVIRGGGKIQPTPFFPP